MDWTKKAEIHGHRIEVRAVASGQWKNRLGLYCEDTQTIQLKASCTPQLQKHVAIHELTHAIDTLYGLRISDVQTDRATAVLAAALLQSQPVLGWLSGPLGVAIGGAMPVYLLSSRLAVFLEDTPLWEGHSAHINLQDGTLLIEKGAGEQEQRIDFLEALLESGLSALHAGVSAGCRRALAEGWISLLRNSPDMIDWWKDPSHGPIVA